ncbi:glycosyltransferase family 2 protein [Pedobacter jeongneungensis]
MNISLLTLVKNRKPAIINMLAGLCKGNRFPSEVVIIHMNEQIYGLSGYPFPVREYVLSSVEALPLAHARNCAAQKALSDQLVFLDADCIPAEDFLEVYQEALYQKNCLYSGRVSYLPHWVMDKPDLLQLMALSGTADPVRASVDQYPYHLFWSLNFGCSKSVYAQIGGFDETFCGYGAEDTDFSFSARQKGVDLVTIDAMAYHQYHQSYDPPINHLEAIVKNAAIFNEKWGVWPMEGWLEKFCAMGYTAWQGGQLQILRLPGKDEISAVLKRS